MTVNQKTTYNTVLTTANLTLPTKLEILQEPENNSEVINTFIANAANNVVSAAKKNVYNAVWDLHLRLQRSTRTENLQNYV